MLKVYSAYINKRNNILNQYYIDEEDVLMDCYYSYTTIIRKNGGEYYACGIDLGAKEKTAQLHGGLMYPGAGAEFHTHNYSSEFIKIRVEEIEEIGREDNEI